MILVGVIHLFMLPQARPCATRGGRSTRRRSSGVRDDIANGGPSADSVSAGREPPPKPRTLAPSSALISLKLLRLCNRQSPSPASSMVVQAYEPMSARDIRYPATSEREMLKSFQELEARCQRLEQEKNDAQLSIQKSEEV